MQKLAAVLTLCLLYAIPSLAQDVHEDTCSLMPETCNKIGIDHGNGFCDNTDGWGTAYPDFDCRDYAKKGERSWDTMCLEESSMGAFCQAQARVLCPGFNPHSQYVTFTCQTDGIAMVRAGILGYDSQGRPMKGVSCSSGTGTSCGCTVTSPTTSMPFGNPVLDYFDVYTCQ